MNGRTTYQGKIIKPDGYPLEASSVHFRFTVLDPTAACVLYIEDYSNVNMSGSGGLISLTLGLGVRSFPSSGTLTFAQAFDNSTPMFNCQTPGAYNPVPTDNRRIVMQFNDGLGWQTLPSMAINAVPYAMYANKSTDSLRLNNKTDSAFVEYSTLAGLGCAANQALHFNGVSFTCLNTGGSYTVTANDVTTALGFTPTNATSFTTLSSATSTSFTTVTNTINSVSSSVTSLAASTAASLAAITSSQWSTVASGISYSSGNVGIGTSDPTSKFHVEGGAQISSESGFANLVFRSGNTSSFDPQITFRTSRGSITSPTAIQSGDSVGGIYGAPHNGSSYVHNAFLGFITDTASQGTGITLRTGTSGVRVERLRISSTGNVGIGTVTPATKLSVLGGLQISMESATCAVSYAGTLRYNAGNVQFCNGTAWTELGAGAVTSSTVTAAYGYTPANASSVATSFTTVTNSLTTVGSSFTAVNNTLTALTSSHTNLAAAVSAITSSQWNTSGTTINYLNGNVGIGTTAPTEKLEVTGKLLLTNGFSSSNGAVLYKDDTDYLYLGPQAGTSTKGAGIILRGATNTTGGASAGTLSLGSMNNAYALNVAPNTGNVGIGTAAPETSLHINNASNYTGTTPNFSSYAATIGTNGSANVGIGRHNNMPAIQGMGTGTSYALYLNPAAGNVILANGGGNVGIGTTSATARLTVSGSVVTPTNEITTGSAVNLALSNTHYLASVGGSTITLSNMVNGGVYTIIVADTTPRTYTFPGCAASYFSPANDDTDSGSQSIYGITTVYVGGTWRCYITWSSGFVP